MANNSYYDNIRIISNTASIEEKLNKILITDPAVKAAIDEMRVSAATDANGSTDISQGATSATSGTSGTGQSGSSVSGLTASPLQNGTTNTSSSALDAALLSLLRNNTAQATDDPKNGDLSSKANDTSNGAGSTGSGFTDQSLLGVDNPDWQKILTAMTGSGATSDQILAARQQFLKQALGIDDVGDVKNGTAGPKPASQSNTDAQDANSPPVLNDVINGVVGVSALDNALAVLLRFDNLPIKPSDSDATNNGQNTWPDDPTQAPTVKSYLAGEYWSLFSGSTLIASDSFEGMVSSREAIGPTQCYSIGLVGGVLKITNINPQQGDEIQFGALGHAVGDLAGAVGGTQYNFLGSGLIGAGQYGQRSCAGVTDPSAVAACGITVPPTETAWPKVGLATLSLVNGLFTYSPFDSEIPLSLQGNHSTVPITSLSTGQTYNISPSINGGFIIADFTITSDGYFLAFNANRTLIGPISNQFIQFYTPRSQ